MNEIPNALKSDDIVFHYTSLDNALNILRTKKLFLNLRTDSNDPIESCPPFITQGAIASCDAELNELKKRGKKGSDDIYKQLKSLNEECKHLCFCMNDLNIEYKDYENMGFLKPRMWDQYAENYTGVCLAFSLKKLDLSDTLHREIEYLPYRSLKNNSFYLDWAKSDQDTYDTQAINKLKSLFFKKHKDYIGEREYRVCSFSNIEKNEIDIGNSLKGIVISYMHRNGDRKPKEEIFQLLDKNHSIDILHLSWFSNGFCIETEEYRAIVRNLKRSA